MKKVLLYYQNILGILAKTNNNIILYNKYIVLYDLILFWVKKYIIAKTIVFIERHEPT